MSNPKVSRRNPIRKRAAMIAAQLRANRLSRHIIPYGQLLKLVDRQIAAERAE